MSDPNLRDFYGRVARIEQAHSAGMGFEAEGALGRSHYRRPDRSRRGFVKPLLLVLLCGFGMKATIHYKVGAASYDARVTALKAGEGFDLLGAALMQADPVTVFLSAQIARGVAALERQAGA
ncbi:hypothetical protein GEU84_017210 [Fertoebacter nigrum]|uniref:Uncharacterized protein n=1 Tax=Fertoeibacter niger TaxID=2656921 RepID=A0A8X8H2V7_9RHOB|nr:hypothetical protein [Fertoeibacter niger]NUB46135.1 hypothetical protein [Fertoeibacter niger]